MHDLAVVGQDPRFGDGVRSQMEAFWMAAEGLGQQPHLFHMAHPSLDGRPFTGPAADERTPVPAVAAKLDGLNQAAAGIRIGARLGDWRSTWVVATTAPAGYGAARSGRRYGCWIGTSLEDEWRGRRAGLSPSRRAALALNAPVLRRLERIVLRRATSVYATSAYSAALVAEASELPHERIRVLPISVDVDRFAPEPDARWEARLDTPTLAFVGRASDPRKNMRLLLDALPLIRARLPQLRLRLIGEPPHEPLPAGAEALGRVHSVAPHLRTATLLVVPSLQEGFCVAAAEALACGVPVLATPCGGPEELLRRSGGGRELGSFARAELVETVVELLRDPATLCAMRSRGREYVAREHSPARLRELLRDALAEIDGR